MSWEYRSSQNKKSVNWLTFFHGNFKVKSFGRSMVILEGIPGTSARQDYIAKWKKIKARNNLYKLNKSKKSKRS